MAQVSQLYMNLWPQLELFNGLPVSPRSSSTFPHSFAETPEQTLQVNINILNLISQLKTDPQVQLKLINFVIN